MNIKCPAQVNKKILELLREKSINSNKEICGFIVDGKFIETTNIHPHPEYYFLINPNECIWGDNVILFHSHIKENENLGFSEWDLENQFYFQLKMLLYSVKYDEFYFKDVI